MTFYRGRVRVALVSVVLTVVICMVSEVASVKGREEPHSFTIDELLSAQFEHKHSNDLGMDPCKAGKFYR